MSLKHLLTRHYTKSLEGTQTSVYDLFEWHKVDVQLLDYSTGKVIVDLKDLEFPVHFSQSACDIIATKYFRKNQVPTPTGTETSFKQVVHRMVDFWIEAALDEGLIPQDSKQVVYDELAYMMIAQMWAPNSPQWFNTGLKKAYGIAGSKQGHYYYDEKSKQVVLSPDAYTRTQGSACFILSVEDTLLGDHSLTDVLTTETRLFKYGSGVGSNWSSIRSSGEKLSGGGKSSGLMSFLKVFDRNAGAIKSGGTTRRAAKMNVLNIDHPEIESFITWKAHEEEKVARLGKMGYDTHFDGEAYETVSGQNANNSVRVTDAFMNGTQNPDTTFSLINRTDHSVAKELSCSSLFDTIAKAAWSCGDPGIQFDDTINSWHTCPAGENGDSSDPANRIHASNPCSEYMFLDNTACNLASINIAQFYNPETETWDFEGYLHCIKMVQIVLEATIHKGQFPTPEIAKRSYDFRTTGLGLTNIGALLMMMGIPYDSEEARATAAGLMSLLTGYSYYISSLFAESVGPFTYYPENKPHMLSVLAGHSYCAGVADLEIEPASLAYKPYVIPHKLLHKLNLTDLSKLLKKVWKDALVSGTQFGYRNAQVSVLAPTGTIAFAMDCATTSSEPFFSHIVYKKLVGGGTMQIVNPILGIALKKLGYSTSEIEEITTYILKEGHVENAPYLKPEHYRVFDTANKSGTGSRYILPTGHVHMMAALTPQLSGAISKTVNLPHDATVEDVKEIYLLSWKLGVKAIALYRDGCKVCQPLTTSLNQNTTHSLEHMSYEELLDYAKKQPTASHPHRTKPIGIRNAHVHEAEMGGLKLYITISFYEDGSIGEIYVSAGRQGSLIKGLLDSISTTLSKMFQYGVPAEDISRMYRGQKFEPSGFVTGHPYIRRADSISDLISKIIDIELGNYSYCQVKPSETVEIEQTPDTETERLYGEICSVCKSHNLIRNGTCKVCQDCGTTTGCS